MFERETTKCRLLRANQREKKRKKKKRDVPCSPFANVLTLPKRHRLLGIAEVGIKTVCVADGAGSSLCTWYDVTATFTSASSASFVPEESTAKEKYPSGREEGVRISMVSGRTLRSKTKVRSHCPFLSASSHCQNELRSWSTALKGQLNFSPASVSQLVRGLDGPSK